MMQKTTPNGDVSVSIHLNKLLNTISKALEALESYNLPQNREQIVDYGARLGLLAKRTAHLADDCKETLWDSLRELELEGITIKGDRFEVSMQVVLQERFDSKGFKAAHPEEAKKWIHDTIVRRATFKPRG